MPILELSIAENSLDTLTNHVVIEYPYGKLRFLPRYEYVRTYPYKKHPFTQWRVKANRPIVWAIPGGRLAEFLRVIYMALHNRGPTFNRLSPTYEFIEREDYEPDRKRYNYWWWHKHNGRDAKLIKLESGHD